MTAALGSQKDRLKRFAAIVFFTVVALYFSMILYNVYQGFRILQYGQQAQAVVIKKSLQSYDDEGGRQTIPTVEYEYQVVGDHGKLELFVGQDAVPQKLYESLVSGSMITILYLPSKPFVSGVAGGGRTDIANLTNPAIFISQVLVVITWSVIKSRQRRRPRR